MSEQAKVQARNVRRSGHATIVVEWMCPGCREENSNLGLLEDVEVLAKCKKCKKEVQVEL